jgi:tetratricopeptide (TPR) repeat protein
MSWPTPQDYNEAVQIPSVTFEDAQLREGVALTDKNGIPRPVSGAFASVYHFRCTGRDWAVRCFLHNIADQQKRYEELSRFVDNDDLECTVPFTFMSQGIRVHGQWYPLLKMEWVRGINLNAFIEQAYNLNMMPSLGELADRFKAMCLDLDRVGIAHGDLQHGNIMVVGDGHLRLVDYDGMYVPALRGWQSNELGHRNYQHPRRSRIHFGPYLDNFSAWVIYTSLRAVSIEPKLWRLLHGGDECLLLRQTDFEDPLSSTAFAALEHVDEEIATLARSIRYFLTLPVEQIPGLDGKIDIPRDLPEMPSARDIEKRREERLQRKREEAEAASAAGAVWMEEHGGVATQTKTKPKVTVSTAAAGATTGGAPAVGGSGIVTGRRSPTSGTAGSGSGQSQPWYMQGSQGSQSSTKRGPGGAFVIAWALMFMFGIFSASSNHRGTTPIDDHLQQLNQQVYNGLESHNYSQVIGSARRVVGEQSNNLVMINNIAFAERQLRQYDFAISDANQVLRAGPNNGAYLNRAAATVQMVAHNPTPENKQLLQGAIADLDHLMLTDRSNQASWKGTSRSLFQYYRGYAYELSGNLSSAKSDYENAISDLPAGTTPLAALEANAMGPTSIDLHNRLGLVEAKSHDYKAAVAQFTECLKYGEYSNIRYNRALAYKNIAQPMKAMQDITVFITSNPSDPNGYSLRAQIHTQLRQASAAKADFARAQQLRQALQQHP